jgi:RND family efflux transporter MFP subunit
MGRARNGDDGMKGVAKMREAMRAVPRKTAVAAALLVLAVTAGLLYLVGGRGDHGVVLPERPVVSGVEVMTVSPADEETFAEAMGTIRALHLAPVAPQVMGRVLSVNFAEGSRVEKGAVLAVIDDAHAAAQLASAEGMVAEARAAVAEAEAAIAQAEAARSLAKRTYERYRRLHEEKVVTSQEFDEVEAKRTMALKEHERALEKRAQAQAKIAQAQGQASAARTMHSYAKVKAPFAGIITEKRIETGSLAVPGQPIALLEDTSRYRLEAAVPEAYLPDLAAGTPVEVVLDAMAGRPVPATISEVVPSVDPASRTFIVKADVAGPGLRSGLFGRLRFPTGTGTVLAVPQGAVAHLGGYEGVFLVTPDNVARLVIVTTGRRMDDRVEILSGIEPGARIAVAPQGRLEDGVRVEVRQ